MRLSAELFQQIIDALKSDVHKDRDKRLEPRVGMAGEAILLSIRDDGKKVVVRVRVRDVSHSGIGLWLSNKKRLANDQRFIIQLQSQSSEPIWLMCVTAYCRRQTRDSYTVGARISQVLRGEEIRKIESEFGALEFKLGFDISDTTLTPSQINTADRISRAILN